jgi:hypothetical protein
MNSRVKGLLGHGVRWLFILLSLLVICKALIGLGNSSLRIERVVETALNRMEMTDAPISIRTKMERGYELLLMKDLEHGMYHQLNVKRSFGFLWSIQGGSVGLPMDSEVLLSFQGGGATVGKFLHFFYVGQLNDPQISRLQIRWSDGVEQEAEIKDGLYQVARVIRSKKNDELRSRDDKLCAYDANGQLLYELDWERREIRSDKDKNA